MIPDDRRVNMTVDVDRPALWVTTGDGWVVTLACGDAASPPRMSRRGKALTLALLQVAIDEVENVEAT